jgi:hypothetical protein
MTDARREFAIAPTSLTRKDGTSALSHGPARGYSWPSAGPDNFLAVKHGAWSARIVAERAGQIREQLLDDLARWWSFQWDAPDRESAKYPAAPLASLNCLDSGKGGALGRESLLEPRLPRGRRRVGVEETNDVGLG